MMTLTKQTIRAVKSLARERNERQLYPHEIRALSELRRNRLIRMLLIDGGPDRGPELTQKGKRLARFHKSVLESWYCKETESKGKSK